MGLRLGAPVAAPASTAGERGHGGPLHPAPGCAPSARAVCLGGAQKPDPCQCSRVSTKNRLNCGFPGISSDQCFSASCCFDSSIPGVPWCFKPLPKQESEECVMEVSARENCGYPGISPEECASRKCCFSDTIPQVPWCFFPLSVQDCHY
ncbi:LOW QUALITY PROTEIN: trefoil factor 2 [Sagmatias obliquidens]|uniref:LOW QUALITY PROTEIN: trefoil factor 2 n=1 Tax=Sagmatias obliquidens TaxID=3371155 RepID=UPI000F443183|nr:LOW QUALITY PROTEIN: trefoil factor 2 [Lagenorhynchus obliquidens]